jgi:hypothetical protein
MKEYEVCDGFCLNDKVKFRIPLRGMAPQKMSPTKINVFNKFSVRYFVRVKVLLRRPVVDAAELAAKEQEEDEAQMEYEESQ